MFHFNSSYNKGKISITFEPDIAMHAKYQVSLSIGSKIFGMHGYLMRPQILRYDMSRSSLKVKGQMNITFEPLKKETLYLNMHVHLIKAHLLTDDMSRSMSPFKVKY